MAWEHLCPAGTVTCTGSPECEHPRTSRCEQTLMTQPSRPTTGATGASTIPTFIPDDNRIPVVARPNHKLYDLFDYDCNEIRFFLWKKNKFTKNNLKISLKFIGLFVIFDLKKKLNKMMIGKKDVCYVLLERMVLFVICNFRDNKMQHSIL